MNDQAQVNDDLGIEYYDDIIAKENQQPKESENGGKIAKTMAFGAFGTQEGRRNIARTGSRIAETLVGMPGDIRELVGNVAIAIPEYFAGEELPKWRQTVKGTPGMLGGITSSPTSEEIREGITKPIGGEYLEPQSKYEEFGDAIAQDFAALAIPVKGKVPFAKSLGSSIIANSGAEVAKAFGGDKAEAATKLGLLFTTGIIGQKGGGVKKYINNLYKDMESTVPKSAEVSASGLSRKLDQVESILKKGDPMDASKQPAFQKITAVREKIRDGVIPVEEVIELTKSINESIFGLGDLKRGQNKLYDIRKALHDTSKEYGSQNPDFLSKWQSANEAYAATETSRKVGNWVKKNIKAKDYLYAAGALGLEGSIAGAPSAIATIGGAAGLGATAYSAEVMKRIAKSPALRKYYQNVVSNSLKENKLGFTRAMKQLDNGIQKSFEEEPYKTVEFND